MPVKSDIGHWKFGCRWDLIVWCTSLLTSIYIIVSCTTSSVTEFTSSSVQVVWLTHCPQLSFHHRLGNCYACQPHVQLFSYVSSALWMMQSWFFCCYYDSTILYIYALGLNQFYSLQLQVGWLIWVVSIMGSSMLAAEDLLLHYYRQCFRPLLLSQMCTKVSRQFSKWPALSLAVTTYWLLLQNRQWSDSILCASSQKLHLIVQSLSNPYQSLSAAGNNIPLDSSSCTFSHRHGNVRYLWLVHKFYDQLYGPGWSTFPGWIISCREEQNMFMD